MTKSIFLALLAVLGLGCHHYSIHQTVAIDASFTGYELDQVMAGLDDWRANTPATFDVRLVAHGDLANGLENGLANLIIYRIASPTDAPCPTQGAGELAASSPATTFELPGEYGVTCVNAQNLLAVDGNHPNMGSYYKGAVTHELGHSMGLVHAAGTADVPAAMYWHEGTSMADHLQCGDLAQFAKLWPSDYALIKDCAGATFTAFH